MKLKPLAGYLVIKREEVASQTASGIFVTGDSEKPQKGIVLAVGPGKEGRDAQVKEGQTVLFKKYGPTELEINPGEMVLVLEEEDVLAIVE